MTLSLEVEIYQLRVYLREISPTIWCRLLLRSDSTITDLHYTLQIAMGWTDFHLHQFVIRGKRYGVSRIGSIGFTDDSDQVRLSDFRFRRHERFLYEYDLGDLWQHEIRQEETHPLNPKKTYPCCIGGVKQAPQEDCGGPRDFLALESHYSLPYSLPYMAERSWEIIEEGRRDEYWECAVSGLRFLVPSLPQKPELLTRKIASASDRRQLAVISIDHIILILPFPQPGVFSRRTLFLPGCSFCAVFSLFLASTFILSWGGQFSIFV